MNSFEKLERTLALVPPKDRTEIPVFPHIITWAGTVSGISQADIIADCGKWLQAMEKTFETVGVPDVSMPQSPQNVIFTMGLPARVPGIDLGENELYQFKESPQFEVEEYETILKMGWGNWYMKYLMSIQKPPIVSFEELGTVFGSIGQEGAQIGQFMGQRGIPTIFHSALFPIFDMLSMIRSMGEFALDLYDDPAVIMDIINKFQPEEDAKNIELMKQIHGTRIGNYAMRSSASFISPSMFEEYVWPALRKSILTYWEAGIMTVLHADGNWLPMLKYFTELPKGSVQFELDGTTDIFAAYDIVGGWHSMRGDVPASMLTFDKPDDVRQYCETLIDKIGMKGGFILGSGCEVPMNANVECVKAMIDSVR